MKRSAHGAKNMKVKTMTCILFKAKDQNPTLSHVPKNGQVSHLWQRKKTLLSSKPRLMSPYHRIATTKTETQPARQRTRRLVESSPGKRRIENLVAGILLDKERFLVEKRRLDKEADPGYIEIPGGHVERGETFEEALRREMKEELGIHVEKARMIGKALTTATNGERGRIHYFHIEKWQGRIRSSEAERVYWESDVSKLSISPDQRLIRNLLKDIAP